MNTQKSFQKEILKSLKPIRITNPNVIQQTIDP